MMIAISMILLFVGIGLLILIHVCIVGRAYRRGIGNTNIVERGNSLRSNSMSHEDIEKLPSFAFQTKDKGTSPLECAICLANLKLGEKCRLLPYCTHTFHAECIDLWLLKTSICPICRTTADSTTGGSISGGESSRFSESGRREMHADLAENGNYVNSLSFEMRRNSISSRFDESESSRFNESGRHELDVETVDADLAGNDNSVNSLSFEMRRNNTSSRLDKSGSNRFNESERQELNAESNDHLTENGNSINNLSSEMGTNRKTSRFNESGTHELNAEVADLDEHSVNSISFETRASSSTGSTNPT